MHPASVYSQYTYQEFLGRPKFDTKVSTLVYLFITYTMSLDTSYILVSAMSKLI